MKFSINSLIIIILFTIGCKKNEDLSPPSIEIISPSPNTSFSVYDSINIHVKVSDNIKLDWVKFDVIDQDNHVIVSQKERSNLSNSEEINISLSINNIHINSGNYFIRFVASDGSNTKNSFLEIFISEHPRELTNTFLIPNQNSNSIDSLDLNNNPNQFISFTSDIKKIICNSYHHEILVAMNNPSQLVLIKENNYSEPQTINVSNDFNNSFYRSISLDEYNNKSYISTYEKQVLVIGKDGVIQNILSTSINHRPFEIQTTDTYLIVEEKSTSSSSNILNVYYKNSGEIFKSHFLDYELIGIEMINQNELILFGNINNDGIIAKYYINENIIIPLIEIGELDQIIASCKMNANNFSYATSNEIAQISLNNNNFNIENLWSINTRQLVYNKLNLQLYGINEANLFILQSNNTITNISSGNFKELCFFFNK